MMLGVPGGTAPIEPVSGRAAIAAAVQHRKLSGTWRLPAFATGGDRRLFHKLTRVGALVDALPDGAFRFILGEEALAQIQPPDAHALALRLLEQKAGPEGDLAGKALRSLKLLKERALRTGLPGGGLPAGRALVASIVAAEGRRAENEATGSQGGSTVAGTIREGFVYLQKVARLPIEASDELVRAAAEAPPGEADTLGGRTVRHAASLP